MFVNVFFLDYFMLLTCSCNVIIILVSYCNVITILVSQIKILVLGLSRKRKMIEEGPFKDRVNFDFV